MHCPQNVKFVLNKIRNSFLRTVFLLIQQFVACYQLNSISPSYNNLFQFKNCVSLETNLVFYRTTIKYCVGLLSYAVRVGVQYVHGRNCEIRSHYHGRYQFCVYFQNSQIFQFWINISSAVNILYIMCRREEFLGFSFAPELPVQFVLLNIILLSQNCQLDCQKNTYKCESMYIYIYISSVYSVFIVPAGTLQLP